jgi:hypothetical protein
MNGGRPLRFFAAVMVMWVGARAILLWPSTDVPATPPGIGSAPAYVARASRLAEPERRHGAVAHRAASHGAPRIAGFPRRVLNRAWIETDPVRVQFALLGLLRYGEAEVIVPPPPSPRVLAGASPMASRWQASGWLLTRGGANGQYQGGALGGDQAGLRIAYALDRRRGVSLFGRVSTPLAGLGREGAVGVEWQPGRLPIRLVAEQRIGLDRGAKSGPAIGAIAGIYGVGLPADFRLEGYAQAGAVFRRQTDPYIDGSARAMRLLATLGDARLDLGAGAWGGAQRGAARLDIGPSVSATIPLGGRTFRLSLDWRQRVAGDARPGSGPAFTIGADF